jgi:protein phosphatase inhibitor 2
MKITEPKTPYTRRYDPSEDPSDDEAGDQMQVDHPEGGEDSLMAGIDDIPGLDLGEPAEAVPPPDTQSRVEVAEEPSSRPSTRGRRDSTKQVVVEEIMPEKDPEPDGILPPVLPRLTIRGRTTQSLPSATQETLRNEGCN